MLTRFGHIFSTFGIGKAALKKRPLFNRSGPVVNRQNWTIATKCSLSVPRGPSSMLTRFGHIFSTFGIGKAALKKRPLFNRSGPVVNRQN